MTHTRASLAILFCMAFRLTAQFQPPLEAETPEEFDLYLTLEESQGTPNIIERIDLFRARYPNSQLLPRVWELRFFVLQKQGKGPEARAAGEEALRLAPGNLTVRASLALQLASDDGPSAQQHASVVLDELDRAKIKRAIPWSVYQNVAATLRGQARTALGIVLYRNGDVAGSLRELEAADKLAPSPALSYRLGRLYTTMNRFAEARKRLTEAANAADPALAERGRVALAELP